MHGDVYDDVHDVCVLDKNDEWMLAVVCRIMFMGFTGCVIIECVARVD